MENFYYSDIFCKTIGQLIDVLKSDGYEITSDFNNLDDNFSVKVSLTKLQKMFFLDDEFILKSIISNLDIYENRFPDDSDVLFEEIESAIIKSIDSDKLNQLIPSLYYLTGEETTITKSDIVKYLKR